MFIYRKSPETHGNELAGHETILHLYSIINTEQSQSLERESIWRNLIISMKK